MTMIEVARDDLAVLAHLLPAGVVYDGNHLEVAEVDAPAVDALLADIGAHRASSFADLKSRLKLEIDAAAEVERLKYITPGAGQAMTYQQKMEEVRALAQDVDPDAANYPLLSAEVGVTAPTLADVAAVVLAAFSQWQLVGAAIEGTRLAAKGAVDAAETAEAAQAAASEVVWPTPN